MNLHETRREGTRAYFTTFLPGLRGQLLIPGLRSLSCRLAVRIEGDEPAAWTLVVTSGCLMAVEPGENDAQCVFRLDSGTLLEIATGSLAPDRAFFDLRVEIEGDVALGLQLSTVLEPFFQQHPFRLART